MAQFFQTHHGGMNFLIGEHKCCYYHYSQAIRRKLQVLGLQEEYRSEDGILKSFAQKTPATCFVPPSFVRVTWHGVQQEAPELDSIDDFVTYFDRMWINGQFRLKQWIYYNYSGLKAITLKTGTPG